MTPCGACPTRLISMSSRNGARSTALAETSLSAGWAAARDAVDMHAGQLSVSPETVRELVDDQFPRWRSLAIQAVDSAGTVNAIFRIGGRLAARFALKPGDAGLMRRLLESEAAAARELA